MIDALHLSSPLSPQDKSGVFPTWNLQMPYWGKLGPSDRADLFPTPIATRTSPDHSTKAEEGKKEETELDALAGKDSKVSFSYLTRTLQPIEALSSCLAHLSFVPQLDREE